MRLDSAPRSAAIAPIALAIGLFSTAAAAQQTQPAAPPPAAAPAQQPPPGYAPAPGYPPGYAPAPGYAPPPGYGPPGPYYYAAPPMPPPPPPVPMQRRSTAMLVGGAVLTGLGGVGIISGLAMIDVANNRTCTYAVNGTLLDSSTCKDAAMERDGVIVLITGSVFLAAGIPLMVIGGHKVPVAERAQGAEPALRPVLVARPGGGSIRMSF